MLLRTAQLGHRFVSTSPSRCRILLSRPPRHTHIRTGDRYRIFSTRGALLYKQNNDKSTTVAVGEPQKIASHDAALGNKAQAPSKPAGKKPDLLAEATVTRKEQRKADWAIMKEMTKYLWPKVRVSFDTDPRFSVDGTILG